MRIAHCFLASMITLALIAGFVGCGDTSTKDKTADGSAKDAVVTKDTASKDAAVKDAAVKDSTAKDAATKDAAVKDGAAKDAAAKDATAKDGGAKGDEGVSLFDGKTMGKWKVTNFGGEGEVEIKDGVMTIYSGSPLSGVTWQGEPPMKIDYEITLEAQRVEGGDFFLGLTVPVKDDAISLILGGWGGTLVGLSSIDGADASENEYTSFHNFKHGQWYKVRMVVKEKQILAFIDGEKVVDANIDGRKVGTRVEVDLNKPLGIATFSTTGAFRNMKMKKLP